MAQMEPKFAFELKNVTTKSENCATHRNVKFVVDHEESSEGPFYTLQLMDEDDPVFYFLTKINQFAFRQIVEKNELTFQFPDFGAYLENMLGTVSPESNRICEVDYENAPKLLIVDTSDKWRRITLLQIQIQLPQDFERIEHLALLSKARLEKIRSFEKSQEELECELEKYRQKSADLELRMAEVKQSFASEKQRLIYEHTLEISNLSSAHESEQKLQIEKHRNEIELKVNEFGALKQKYSDLKKILKRTEDSDAKGKLKTKEQGEIIKKFEEKQTELLKNNEEFNQRIVKSLADETEFKRTIQDFEKRFHQMQEEKEELGVLQSDRMEQIILLELEKKQTKTEIENLTKNLQSLQEKEKDFISQKTELEYKSKEFEKIDSENAEMKNKLERAAEKLKTYEVENARATDKITFQTSEIEKLREELKRNQELYQNMITQNPTFATANCLNFNANAYPSSPSPLPTYERKTETDFHLEEVTAAISHEKLNFEPKTSAYDFHSQSQTKKYSWMDDFS